jgi:hypothetical protein
MNQPSARSSESLQGAYVFRIYIADGTPNSVRALANLYAICHQHFPESHRIEVIDILKEPFGLFITWSPRLDIDSTARRSSFHRRI